MSELVKMSAEEKAYFESGGQVNPYPNEKVEAEGAPEEAREAPKEPPQEEPKQEAEKPEAEEEEEVTEVADGTDPDGKPRRKVIAFSAYEKQRHKAKAAAEELNKLREQVAYLSGLAQNPAKPQVQPTQQIDEEIPLTPPDKTKEPEKYLAWLEKGMATLLQKQKQTVEQTQQSTQFQQINQAVIDAEQDFINGNEAAGVEPHPDFMDAVKFLQDRHRAELKTAGYEPHEIQQIMAARAQSVAVKALQKGQNPAERVYELAKLHGYKRAAPTLPKESEAEKITRQAENQKKAGKTISSLPGGEAKPGLTAEMLANMDPKEFQRLWEKGDAKAVLGWVD